MSNWIFILTVGVLAGQVPTYESPDGSWLDAPIEWNSSVPSLLRWGGGDPDPQCDPTTRAPRTAAERLLGEAGWKFETVREVNRSSRDGIEIVQVFGRFGGQCRPFQAQAFVFFNDRLIGTLSPRMMDARSDGYLVEANVSESGQITATFLRYGRQDAMCCPSRESVVVYSVVPAGDSHILRLVRVDTRSRPAP